MLLVDAPARVRVIVWWQAAFWRRARGGGAGRVRGRPRRPVGLSEDMRRGAMCAWAETSCRQRASKAGERSDDGVRGPDVLP